VKITVFAWPADLAGKLDRQTWPSDLASRLGQQTWPADLACRLGRSFKDSLKIESQHCLLGYRLVYDDFYSNSSTISNAPRFRRIFFGNIFWKYFFLENVRAYCASICEPKKV
jgi:hypothetical protein